MDYATLPLKLTLLVWLVAGLATAAEISILYRPRVSPAQLGSLSSEVFGKGYAKLSNQERLALAPFADPLPFGHVALRLPKNKLQEGTVVGWEPVADRNGKRLDADDILEFEKFMYDLMYNYETIKGVNRYGYVAGQFVNNEAWAIGGTLDPTREISFTISDDQLKALVKAIREVNDSGNYHYQLIADILIDEGRRGRHFPAGRFNCVVAVKRVLTMADITPPFEMPEGSMEVFTRVAEPFHQAKTCQLINAHVAGN